MTDNIQQIWRTLAQVPAGCVVSYGQLADLAGLPNRARLAARALRLASPQQQLPWHRVIGASGKISINKASPAYALQIELLRSEGVEVHNGRIKMKQYQWQPSLAELLWQLDY